MKDEIAKVLTMMEQGKIDSEKAAELISILKEKGENPRTVKSSSYLNKTLKIRVQSHENDNVKVNLPVRLCYAVLKAGHGIAASLPESQKYVKDLDIDLILEAIEHEVEGQIVDIASGNGDKITIYIE